MTHTIKTLAQSNPAATTPTDLYTVPASTSTIISSIVVCNRAATTSTFRVSVAVAGAALDVKQYLYFDVLMPPNDTFIATIGITLATTDVIRVYASTTNLTFNLYGEEIS